MTRQPTIMIGLDAADPVRVNEWMDSGEVPRLAALRQSGAMMDLRNAEYFCSETGWTNVFTGVKPDRTGFWNNMAFDGDRYDMRDIGAYRYNEYPPFYALGKERRVAVIDLPQATISDEVNGVQVLAYGSHTPFTPRKSDPPELLDELIAKYGEHIAGQGKDRGRMWQKWSLRILRDKLISGCDQRGKICADLLGRERWDLFLTVFGEYHSGGHLLEHLSNPDHPFYNEFGGGQSDDPLLQVVGAMDRNIGRILDAAPDDANVIVFSQEGMQPNYIDAPTMLYLPELLFRYSFPGHYGLCYGGPPGTNTPPQDPLTHPLAVNWARAVWGLRHDENGLRRFLRRHLPMEISHLLEKVTGAPQGPGPAYPKSVAKWFLPTMWYAHLWPQMKAFVVPTFSEGCIRINVKGREGHGVVEPKDYDAVCTEITEHVMALRNARTGGPIVREVRRTRNDPFEDDAGHSPADLVAIYDEDPADIADSPSFGRMGPVPPCRSGSHRNRGFVLLNGPAFAALGAGVRLPDCQAVDLAPTVRALAGLKIPAHMQGTSLLDRVPPAPAQAAE